MRGRLSAFLFSYPERRAYHVEAHRSIAPEDLPRIFEKGYTGYNGRSDQKASGLGLYLCRTICRRLGHTITASSVPDHGTAIRIALDQRRVRE